MEVRQITPPPSPGTTTYGGKGSKGRAANGDRPTGAAGCRREQHTKGVMATPSPPPPGDKHIPDLTPCPSDQVLSGWVLWYWPSKPFSDGLRRRNITLALAAVVWHSDGGLCPSAHTCCVCPWALPPTPGAGDASYPVIPMTTTFDVGDTTQGPGGRGAPKGIQTG